MVRAVVRSQSASALPLAAECAGLIGDLPRHDGGRFCVGLAGDAVGAAHHVAHMVEGELTGGIGEHELAGVVDVFAVSVFGERCGCVTCPFEICAVAAAPFPGVVEIEHGFHVALLKFGKEVVESFEKCVVVNAGGCLQHRFYVRFKPFSTIAADEHAEVGETELLEEVELACRRSRSPYFSEPRMAPYQKFVPTKR